MNYQHKQIWPREVIISGKMYKNVSNLRDTIIIFFPFSLENITNCFVLFDFETFDNYVKIIFVTKLFYKNDTCLSLLSRSTWNGDDNRLKRLKNWISLEMHKNVLSVKQLNLNGDVIDIRNYHMIWVNYNFDAFSQCEVSSDNSFDVYSEKSYFKYFKEKINENVRNQNQMSRFSQSASSFLNLLSVSVLKISNCHLKGLFFTKYFNVALHIDTYLSGFVWAAKSVTVKKQLDVKVVNFLLSVFLDMLLGILFLKWLNSKVSLDSSSTLFLLTTESIVNSIKDLINWLRGDPAGLKLNWAFNNVLATFFSFHIDIWWTFIAYLKQIVTVIFQIFLQLGLLGVTFQASITADLLALVSFHVYCIYAYAAKLYSIQISTLISLWRLFLGRKRNPLRQKVDSCRYTPEQLFVGTLGFTVLLFLLPTTLLYYIVFTCIRLSILGGQAVLMFIRQLNQSLPVYSTILWLMRSPKVSIGIEIVPYSGPLKSDFIIMTVKPVIYSWWETVQYFMPDCVPEQGKFSLSELLSSLITEISELLIVLKRIPYLFIFLKLMAVFAKLWVADKNCVIMDDLPLHKAR